MDRKEQIKLALHQLNNDLNGSQAKLLAVSKTKPKEDVQLAYQLGHRNFGENKVQELLDKATDLESSCPEINWHFIGHLQSNKINMLLKVPKLVSIHSIASIKLLNKLLKKNPDKAIGIFLQVNTSKEDEKSGFEEIEELKDAIELLKNHDQFYFQGLMTIGKIRTDDFENEAQKCFSHLAGLKDDLSQLVDDKEIQLSMGMSSDYPIALKLGSNWVRVGSQIFGSRS